MQPDHKGTDASGLVFANAEYFYCEDLECKLFDLEKGWKNYLACLQVRVALCIDVLRFEFRTL